MTERDFIDELRKMRRERMADMFDDWYTMTGRGSGVCDCPSCRQARGHWSPGLEGDALYQLARLHAEGVGQLMRLGASALSHLHGLRHIGPWGYSPGHPHGYDRGARGPAPSDEWPGEFGGYERPPQARHAQHEKSPASFFWAGNRSQKPVFKFVVQNQDASASHHLDVSLGPATTPNGYRPNVSGHPKLETSRLEACQQALVEVTFEVQHCVAGIVCLPVYVHLDGKLVSTHWVKLSVED